MARWIQHPVTGDLVPADEYVRPYAGNRSDLPAPRVVSDNVEFRSMLDGKVVTSKRAYEQSVRAAGCEIVGNETVNRRPATKGLGGEGVKDDLRAAFAAHT